jgi:large subunit ribosomal protein L24
MANKVNSKVKLHVKKGDTVKVLAGDDKGKSGKVLRMLPSTNRAVVEGLNLVTKHYKPSAQNTSGRIEKIEAPIHLSNCSVSLKQLVNLSNNIENHELRSKVTNEI